MSNIVVDNVDEEVSRWNRRFEQCKQLRQPFEEQWYTNYAFYKGRQWVVWDRTTIGNRLIDPVVSRNRVRLVSNKVKPIIRREIAKLSKQEPVWYVVPNTSEPDDVAAARVAQSLTEYILNTAQFQKQRRIVTFWTSICGTGYFKVTCPGQNEDVIIDPIIPWHVYVPELQTEELEKQPYVIIAKAMSKDGIENQYDIEIDAKTLTSGALLEQRFFNALGIKNGQVESKDQVFVKEIWIRPGFMKEYPEGGLIVIAGSKMVYKYHYKPTVEDLLPTTPPVGENVPSPTEDLLNKFQNPIMPTNYPYMHMQFPIIKVDAIPSGGFYGISVIEDLIPLQKERNKTRSQMIETKNRTSNPKLAFMMGSIDPSKVTSDPGQMIPVTPGYEFPKYIESAYPSTQQAQEIELIDKDMDVISAQFEISRGSSPPGIEAASAIAYLQEENDTVLHYNVESIADAIQKVGKQSIELAQQFWDEAKTIKIVSKNNTMDSMIFRVADIKDNTDLRIEADSIAPQSRAARQAFITDLMKEGIIPPEKGLRYLQMNETSRLYEELQVDSRQAQRENQRMTKEQTLQPLAVNPFDNHPVHIYEHGLFMKTQEFEILPQEVQAVMLQHYLLHKQQMEFDLAGIPQQTNLGQSGEPVPGNTGTEQQPV